MKDDNAKNFKAKAVTLTMALTVGSAAVAEDIINRPHPGPVEVPSMSWQETKRTASEYWQEFKQDTGQTWASTQDAFRDGWLEGKLQSAIVLNRHLNPFNIDISVDNNTAQLEGQVDTAVQKELAMELAMGIEGIDDVDNKLTVDESGADEKSADGATPDARNMASGYEDFVDDAMLKADLKTNLIEAESLSSLDINVDVVQSEVTLTGFVSSAVERDLIETIIENNPDVTGVNNHLKIES